MSTKVRNHFPIGLPRQRNLLITNLALRSHWMSFERLFRNACLQRYFIFLKQLILVKLQIVIKLHSVKKLSKCYYKHFEGQTRKTHTEFVYEKIRIHLRKHLFHSVFHNLVQNLFYWFRNRLIFYVLANTKMFKNLFDAFLPNFLTFFLVDSELMLTCLQKLD